MPYAVKTWSLATAVTSSSSCCLPPERGRRQVSPNASLTASPATVSWPAELRDSSLEAGRLLDAGAERSANALFGQPDMAEGIPLLGSGSHCHGRLERRHLSAFSDHDDAEILPLQAAALEVLHDGIQLHR